MNVHVVCLEVTVLPSKKKSCRIADRNQAEKRRRPVGKPKARNVCGKRGTRSRRGGGAGEKTRAECSTSDTADARTRARSATCPRRRVGWLPRLPLPRRILRLNSNRRPVRPCLQLARASTIRTPHRRRRLRFNAPRTRRGGRPRSGSSTTRCSKPRLRHRNRRLGRGTHRRRRSRASLGSES